MQNTMQQSLTVSESLQTISELIQGIPGFSEEANLLVQKAGRLQNQQFTIALFGAFSAGKSSVANCLIGDMVLPVSPNPTTAAINKILPPNAEHPHGTVCVHLKSKEDLWEDVKASLRALEQTAESLEASLQVIETIRPEGMHAHAKPHFSFLKAVVRGWKDLHEHLGTALTIDLKQFKTFVAKEEKACFAEWIDLYYESGLSQNGIVLVDTPGADSINARHTGVAFEYIKNADAILFVTYYNHAFGRADEEFLLQLGRVKDTFSLDKMFFVVNASDLAQTEDELDTVVKHVRQNLVRCGISMPRIYPLSSQTGLLARMMEKTSLPPSGEKVLRQRLNIQQEQSLPDAGHILDVFGIQKFEQEFYKFIKTDLTSIANGSAIADMKRIQERLEELYVSAQADETTRMQRIGLLKNEQQQIEKRIEEFSADAEQKALLQELDELLYYVKQRLFLKYRDVFLYSFNPSVLQDDQKNIKMQLRHCLQELVQNISFTIQQEMRATSLRLEKMGQKVLASWQEKLQWEISKLQPSLHLRPYEMDAVKTPEFHAEIEGDFTRVLSHYRNAKDFFEGGRKDVLRDELEQMLQQPVDNLLAFYRGILKQGYTDAWVNTLPDVRTDIHNQVENYYEGIHSVLTAVLDLDDLKTRDEQIREILKQIA